MKKNIINRINYAMNELDDKLSNKNKTIILSKKDMKELKN